MRYSFVTVAATDAGESNYGYQTFEYVPSEAGSNAPCARRSKINFHAGTAGKIGVVSTFGMFYLGERVIQLDREHIQTLMYLKLSVAGHLTIFVTRTRGPFWSVCPARILLIAVFGTQLVATLIAVYGLFMTPLGWGWALFVWGYALVWFFVNDRIKLFAYRVFDPKAAPRKIRESHMFVL